MKKILITGCTSGLGQAAAVHFAKQGNILLLVARDAAKLEALKSALPYPERIKTLCADLGCKDARKTVLNLIKEQIPDLLINNAGFGFYGSALDSSIELQSQILEVNGKAVLEITLAAALALKNSNKSGMILNVSSIAGGLIYPYFATYAASKGFVAELSRSLHEELKPYNIDVLAFLPGKFASDFAQKAVGATPEKRAFLEMSLEKTLGAMLYQIEKKKPIYRYNKSYQLLQLLARALPFWLTKPLLLKSIPK